MEMKKYINILIRRKNGQVLCAPVRNASKPPSSIDSRRLSVARPSSPPPPPPASVKRHSTGTRSISSSCTLSRSNTSKKKTITQLFYYSLRFFFFFKETTLTARYPVRFVIPKEGRPPIPNRYLKTVCNVCVDFKKNNSIENRLKKKK